MGSNLDIKKLATGIVVALLGFENSDGKFQVEDYLFAGVNLNIEKPLPIITEDWYGNSNFESLSKYILLFELLLFSYIVLVSGLSLSTTGDMLSIELLTDWLSGVWGSIKDQEQAAKIVRVIIAGNSINSLHKPGTTNVINTEVEEHSSNLASIKMLDEMLLELVVSILKLIIFILKFCNGTKYFFSF